MKEVSVNCIIAIFMLTCTGCVSTSISDSITLIEQESEAENTRAVNKEALRSIQALRSSHKIAEQKYRQNYIFAYDWHNKELNDDDKVEIAKLVKQENKDIIISLAPSLGKNKLAQLALSMARAELLRRYISHFNNRIIIKFDPKLSNNTINLEIGGLI